MGEPTQPAPDPALALSIGRAAASLGVSENAFRRHVLPHVRTIAVRRVRVVPVVELERWIYLNARFVEDE